MRKKLLEWHRVVAETSPSLRRAEGTGVVLAGLQPRSDAVFVDGVGAAQWVAALWIHMVLAHQAEFTGPESVPSTCCCCRSLRGRRWPLDGARGHGAADGPRGRPLALCQLEADLLDDFLHGHACEGATRALHLLEQRHQLSPVALWVPSPELLQNLVQFAGRGGCGGSSAGGRWRWNYRVDGLNRRGRGETGRWSNPQWSSDVGLELRLRRMDSLCVRRCVLRWEVGWQIAAGWWEVVGVTEIRIEQLLIRLVWVSRGMDGSVPWVCRRRVREPRRGQRLHDLIESQVSLREKTGL